MFLGFFAEMIRLHLSNPQMCQRHEHKEQIRIMLMGEQGALVFKILFFLLIILNALPNISIGTTTFNALMESVGLP